MRLGDLVKQLGFGKDIESQLFKFQMDLFKVYKVLRKEEITNGDYISQYIFVEVSDYILKKMVADTGIKYFRDFQTKLLSEKFFSHKSDLRWNLYLILIVESYDQFTDTGVLQLIENDADYARKLVMTSKDALQWLDKEWLKNVSNKDNVYIDPMQEWYTGLVDAGLTGCLTEAFAQGHVDNFLEGQAFLTPENTVSQRRTKQDAKLTEVIENITTVELNGFRPHCFDDSESLNLTQVNLLHGSNGAGKTSVMEAIELAFTNEINRCSEFGDNIVDSIESLKVSCTTESRKTIHFQPGEASSFYKKLAQNWYGVPAGRQSSELNSFYHRYNFFDSEAAYRFALNESGQGEKNKFDYSDNLSRLVFGDEVIEAQKKWTRYLQEFDARSEKLTKQHQKVLNELRELQQKLSEITQDDAFQFNELDRHLKAARLKLSRSQRAINESISDYLNRLSLIFHAVEVQRKEIVESGLNVDILSSSYIETYQKQLQNRKNEFINKKRDLETTISKLESEKTALDEQIYQKEIVLINFDQNYNNIKETLEQWKKIKIATEQPEQINLRKNLDIREEEISKKMEWINQLNAKYHLLDKITENDLLILSTEIHHSLLVNCKEKEAAHSILKQQLATKEQLAGVIEVAFSRIHAAGQEYLTNHSNSTLCPLCTQDYGSHQALVDAFKQAKTISNTNGEQLAELHGEIRLLENEIREMKEKLSLHDKNSIHIELVEKAYAELSASHFYTRSNLEMLLIEKLYEFRKIIASRSKLMDEFTQVQAQIRLLDETGMSRQVILQAEYFHKENVLYKEFEANGHSNTFEEFLLEKEASLFTKLSQIKETIEALGKQRTSLTELIEHQSSNFVEAPIKDLEQRLQHISKIQESVKLLFDDFDIGSDDNLFIWSSQVQKTQIYLELFAKSQERLKEQVRLKMEVDDRANLCKGIENYIKRCSKAASALSNLKFLRDYTKGFIESNISQIERFFNLLHTPREFDQLVLDQDGLMLRRKWDEKHVKAYQMSSGQRASLALSVMFAIHLAAPKAPRVLMMDEPVANMDDLHLMNLLDLLRDLSLSGRQIFFTTANPDVANLFRRKFSFYHERFTHFEFMRSSGEPVRVKPIHYSPYMDTPAHAGN